MECHLINNQFYIEFAARSYLYIGPPNSSNFQLPKPVSVILQHTNEVANKPKAVEDLNTNTLNNSAGKGETIPEPVKVIPESNNSVVANEIKVGEHSNPDALKKKDVINRPKSKVDYEQGHLDMCKNSWQKDYTKLHQDIIENEKSKFNIFACTGAGWGNRIRDIICVFHLSVITKRAFILHCNNPSPLDKYLAPRNIKWNYKVNETNLSVKRGYFINSRTIKDRSEIEGKLLNFSVVYVKKFAGSPYQWNAKYLKYDFPVWPNINQMMGCSFYYLFKKSDLLQRKMDQWKQQLGFNDNIVIGIHVRQGDTVFHHNQGDARFKSLDFIDSGFKCAEQLQSKIEEKYKTKKVIWFLAADSQKLKAVTKQKYGDKIKYIDGPVEHVGHPTKGNEDAGHLSMFLDYFLLQESDFRVYPGPSTFDTAVEYLTLGSTDSVRSRRSEIDCVIPPSLLN